jgi:hypothetical protein
MGVLITEVGSISATTIRGDHEVHKELVVALGGDFYIKKSNNVS